MSDDRERVREHNTMIAELLERVAEMEIDKKTKDKLMLILVGAMMTEDGEFVFDKVLRLLDKKARGEGEEG